jgi:replicative DNA helicase
VPDYRTVLGRLRAHLAERARNPNPVYGLPTGLQTLDLLTGGLHPRELTVLAARPGHGKTALAGQILHHAARVVAADDIRRVLLFSLEMPAERIAQRELARLTGISTHRQETGEYSAEEAALLDAALGELAELPIDVYDHGALSVERLRETVLDTEQGPGVALVVIDYLQRVAPRNGARQYDAITQTVLQLTELRDIIQCPVLVLSQLRRPRTGEEAERPDLVDLRDSGAIEECANNVYLLHNPPAEATDTLRPAELLIRKARDGWTGAVPLRFDPERVCFVERGREYPLPLEEDA